MKYSVKDTDKKRNRFHCKLSLACDLVLNLESVFLCELNILVTGSAWVYKANWRHEFHTGAMSEIIA